MLQFLNFVSKKPQKYAILMLKLIYQTPWIILTFIQRFTRGRSWHRKIKTNIRSEDISSISKPPGCPWVSTERGEPIEFDFLGLECDHQVLKQPEPKNLSKTGIFNKILLFLRSFWVLAALKLDGRIPNLNIQILWVLPVL